MQIQRFTQLLLTALLLACLPLMGCNGDEELDGEILEGGRELQEDPDRISPPIVTPPYACTTGVTVQGFIPDAEIEIFADGRPIGGGTGSTPWAQKFPVSIEFQRNMRITARQTHEGTRSEESRSVLVRSHTEDYPGGLPQPFIDPTPLYRCGQATAARNVIPGARLTLWSQEPTTGGFEPRRIITRENNSAAYQTIMARRPFHFKLNHRVSVNYRICGDVSAFSPGEIVEAPAADPPGTPEMGEVYEGGKFAVVRQIVNGAEVTILKNDTDKISQSPAAGGSAIYRLNPTAGAGETLKANQRLCNAPGPDSSEITVRRCDELPAPIIRTPEAGDRRIELTDYVHGSRIIIFSDNEEIGDGGGPLVELVRPLRIGEKVTVVQELGPCRSDLMYRVGTPCNKIGSLAAPSGPYRAGAGEYLLARPLIFEEEDEEREVRMWATVRWPAWADGIGQDPIAGPARLPIVFILHGNHATRIERDGTNEREWCTGELAPDYVEELPDVLNHEGYVYVQEALARMGIIAVSINANDLNCLDDRIRERGELILEHIRFWQRLNDPALPDSEFGGRFHGRVDFNRVGLLGHSRGGEAVIRAVNLNRINPIANIRGVISLAPTDFHGSILNGTPLLMILPARDGDVRDNVGARLHDRAGPGGNADWFKSQFYIYGANHNYFNRNWGEDAYWLRNSGNIGAAPLERDTQEAMLSAWSRLFFAHVLQGREESMPALAGDANVQGVLNDRVFVAHERAGARTVDNYEDTPANAGENSLDGDVNASGFGIFDEAPLRRGATNPLGSSAFFHFTSGLTIRWDGAAAEFVSELPSTRRDNSAYDYLSFRVAQVPGNLNSADDLLVFRVGIEEPATPPIPDRVDVLSSDAGPVPFPYDHPGTGPKAMMHTLRVPLACFDAIDRENPINMNATEAIHFRFAGDDPAKERGELAIDQIQFTN